MVDVVLITGASEGIGRATAFAFARQGYRLSLAARTPETLRQTAIDLEQSLNAEVLAIPTDVTQPEQVQSLVERTLDRYGHIDCLINNAGICLSGPFLQTTPDHWQQLMAVNFWGYIHTIRAVLPHMLKRKQGQIVNVGSIGGKMPLPHMSAYCASKYAVSGLTEALRLELKPQGIHVIGVHPGIVNSDFLKRAIFLDELQSATSANDHDASDTGSPAREQMEQALESFLVSQPEEVATAIWEAVRESKSEVVVGMAQWAVGAYALFPGLIGPILRDASR
ncbi:SDR family oxidoreductase [Thermostichus vulcanus]|uniref:SDR family oxidoreductase n=1 Tax=Thermostichus vulcanus str. 'Rupite' TaxID=2813851 RepID=A0ABT0CDI7_THEVL|nr:SDR family oxidoreductase [Thermostichus vulcanus]MCJ2543385.1 SDR family oxidoreductase [Thermostichus vulcanus str. 'Rupite']